MAEAVAPRLIPLLLGLAALLSVGMPAVAQQKVGVDSAINPHAEGTPPNAATRRIELARTSSTRSVSSPAPMDRRKLSFSISRR